jgi:outer membrane biosynthesis protein TonB
MLRQIKSSCLLLIITVAACGMCSLSRAAQTGAPQDPTKPRRIRLGGTVHPVVKHRVEPKYPKQAIDQGIEGDVQAMVSFGTDGLVKNVKLISGDAILAESVSMSLLEWRYVPLQLNGNPVEVDAPITVTFRLKPKPSVSDDEHPVKGGETVPRQ